MAKVLLAILLAAVVTACSGAADRSPRTQALDLMAKYDALQTVALAAVRSPLLADSQGARAAIKAATTTATAAVLAFDDVTRGCLRDPTSGAIVLRDAQRCEPSAAARLYPVALETVVALQAALITNGMLGDKP